MNTDLFKLDEDTYLKKHHFFEETNILIPSWESIINNFDNCVRNNRQVQHLNNGGVVLIDTLVESLYPYLELCTNLQHIFERKIDIHYYISFTSISETFGLHKDNCCVFFIGGIGVTEFTVIENNIEYKYNISPGQMIYVPKGMLHGTKPLSPRVGLSIGMS